MYTVQIRENIIKKKGSEFSEKDQKNCKNLTEIQSNNKLALF